MTAPVHVRRRLFRPAVLACEAGFGMVELLIAMIVMAVGILAVFALLQSGIVTIRHAGAVSTASALAESEMENYRAVKFSTIGLTDSDVAAADAVYKSDAAYKADTSLGTIGAAITAASTTITVSGGVTAPAAAPFEVGIDDETMEVTDVDGTTWSVGRQSTAAGHSAGAALVYKQTVDLPQCGTQPCTTSVPTETIAGADHRGYRVDTYITWQLVSNAVGTTGRTAKLVTIVVRDPDTSHVYARVSSTFDEATGL